MQGKRLLRNFSNYRKIARYDFCLLICVGMCDVIISFSVLGGNERLGFIQKLTVTLGFKAIGRKWIVLNCLNMRLSEIRLLPKLKNNYYIYSALTIRKLYLN